MGPERCFPLLAMLLTAGAPKDKSDGGGLYKDFAKYQSDIELYCFGLELSEADKLQRPEDRADRFSKWLAQQPLGDEFKATLQTLSQIPHEIDRYDVILAEAWNANLPRCPLVEENYRVQVGACAKGDKAACDRKLAWSEELQKAIDSQISYAQGECAKGLSAKCSFDAQLKQMKQDIRAAKPPPRAPEQIRNHVSR